MDAAKLTCKLIPSILLLITEVMTKPAVDVITVMNPTKLTAATAPLSS